MGRIVVTEYLSIDGVVEAPSGTETFERVGWSASSPRIGCRSRRASRSRMPARRRPGLFGTPALSWAD
jgi:hypothetical protein